MQKKIYLRWDDENFAVDSFEIYRDIAPMDIENLPAPIAIVDANKRYYEDSDVVGGNEYYYRIGAVLGTEKRISSEIVASTSAGDPYWDNVVTLMHFDDGLHDETGKVFSGGLNTTDGKLVANGSAFIDCTHDDFILGNSDFTIESLLTVTDTPNSAAGYGYILNKSPSAPDSDYRLCVSYISGVYRFEFGGKGILSNVISSNEIQPNVEYHVAVVRNGSYISLYLNGVFQQSMDVGVSALTNSAGPIRIGTFSYSSYTHGFRGTIDELRITKGIARYTEDFEPPTEPFPNF